MAGTPEDFRTEVAGAVPRKNGAVRQGGSLLIPASSTNTIIDFSRADGRMWWAVREGSAHPIPTVPDPLNPIVILEDCP